MKSLRIFIAEFFNNKGQHVFLSLLIAKICAFLGALFVIRLLPESEFGTISIVASVFAIFAPFSGFGSQQSLLRFGSVSEGLQEKKALSKYLLLKGFTYQLLLSIIFLLISFFYVSKYEDIFYVFLLFSARLIGFYFLNHLQSEFRIFGNNRGFAKLTNTVNIAGLVLLFLLTYFFGLMGYLSAIAITPFLAFIYFKKHNYKSISGSFNFTKKEIWNYGFHASGTAMLSDLLFSADILMLSFLLDESAVANYKVALLIPANITFLALTFMQSDFPILAKNFQNKVYLRNYIHNYYKIFLPVAIGIFIVGSIFNDKIIHLFFSARYADNGLVFSVLLGAFCLNMLLRNLYGNLLSAVGKMKVNTGVSLVTLALLIVFAGVLVKKFGVLGMAISLSSSMFIGGLLLMFAFNVYLKNLK
ncbi:oligosaccharide flippase family protein [Chryseobacterium sp. MP_3.2]|uniref:oligosaccharide flippase family protein n=1 Tax=Chryseobacterium sp. MP_3.2 TaxID=3071712 RepID=UPI002E06FC67|nr:O-antigen/teichoic acid export membrane protein [Chryseobacterium sp. MP_3.2]